jgi:tetratricopeptide (TPR) repeat protein
MSKWSGVGARYCSHRVTIHRNIERISKNFPFAKLFPSRSAGASRALRAISAAAIATWALASVLPAQAQSPAGDSDDDTISVPVALDAADDTQKDLPKVALTSQIVFQVLAAEIAFQRDQPAPAYQTYMALARETHDPRTAQRAAEIALRSESPSDALAAARLWSQYAPEDPRAGQLDASLLILSSKVDEAQPLLAAQLAKIPQENRGDAILSLQLLISRGPDRIGGLRALQALLQNDLQRPEAQLALARQEINTDDQPAARKSLETALQIKPGYAPAALLLGQLGSDERKEAVDSLDKALESDPKSRDMRMALAQLYLADNQLDAAQKQFDTMRKQDPTDLTPLMALALINIQQKKYDKAKSYLEQFADGAQKQPPPSTADAGQAYIYLAQISLEQKDEAGAAQWLGKIPQTSAQYVPGQITLAQLMAKQGNVDQARQVLAGLQGDDPREQALLIRTDAGLLFDAKRYPEAEARLADASKAFPDDPDITYDYAMAAEKNRHYTLMETQLRHLMALQPGNPQAYNALGYSLADRDQRLDEADKLIEKASALAPNDAFIMDSLGWVKYRMGDKQAAADLLKKAYGLQPNAEIGAHLGEVLWSLGQQGDAKKAWRDARKVEPDNDTLVQTLKRFQVNNL